MGALVNHYCLMIYLQGHPKEKVRDEVVSGAREEFFNQYGAGCNICETCPVCRSLAEMFDPLNPGEYDILDGPCMPLYNEFKNRLGQGSGKILFSHYSPVPDELVQHLFEDRNVKKVYTLQVEHYASTEPANIISALRDLIISQSDYLALDKKEPDLIYEVRRDEYCH